MVNDDGKAQPQPSPSSGGITFGGMILDRKKMEEERLARLKRRRASDDGDAGADAGPARQKQKSEQQATSAPPIANNRVMSTAAESLQSGGPTSGPFQLKGEDTAAEAQGKPTTQAKAKNKPIPVDATGAVPRLPFVDGVVRRTWARGQPRQPDDIRIDEILEKDKLELAVISSFVWDDEWMLSKVDLQRTRLMLIAHSPDERTKADMKEHAPPGVRFCFPPMGGWGCMHSKLQLLKFSNHLRIVVPTGNMVPYDWGETGVMENMVFVIDLPKLADPNQFIPTDFAVELCRFLTASTLDERLVSSLSNYDFSRTKGLAFVHTIGGKHVGRDWRTTGHPGLAAALQSLGLATEDPIEVELVASSIGSLTDNFLTALYRSCQGLDAAAKEDQNFSLATKRMRLHFPSEETVTNSIGGQRSGGTICFQSSWWHSPKFPRQVFRESLSTRPGLLLHTKAILARPAPFAGAGAGCWAYIGSANMSESAWGKLVEEKRSNKQHLTCRNWECGVVVPIDRRQRQMDAVQPSRDSGPEVIVLDHDSNDDLDAKTSTKPPAVGVSWTEVFSKEVPLPIRFPGSLYAASGPGSHPWFFHG